MKKTFLIITGLFIVSILLPVNAEARISLFDRKKEKIVSNACVMSYTDITTNKTIVIRGNSIVVYRRNQEG